MDPPMGLEAPAARDPGAIALVDGERRITRAALLAGAHRLAGALAARGVGPGTRVLCALRNRAEVFEVLFATAALGAEFVPVPWRATADERAYLVADAGPMLMIAEDDAPGAPVDTIAAGTLAHLPAADPPPLRDPAVPLMRFYTSGTTGRPKAVERARPEPATYLRAARTTLEQVGVGGPEEVHLQCGPLYHAAPLAYATYALLAGHRVVLSDRFDAARILATLERERVTWTVMVPIHFVRLLALPERVRAAADIAGVRRILHGAAPCPPDVKRRMMAWFPDAVWEFYGMTEGRGTLVGPDEWLRKPGTVGRPAPGVDIAILDPDGHELGPGEVGLVYVRDGTRFSYAGAPAKTEAAWRGDRFTVGDMGYLDRDGYLFLTDRAIDLIISGGANVYPAEVEAALHEHPAVADCAVIGIPDDEWGERVLAIVQPSGGVTAEGLIEHCRERLASYKCPVRVELVPELPRDEAGKVRKRDLRAPYWAGRARRV